MYPLWHSINTFSSIKTQLCIFFFSITFVRLVPVPCTCNGKLPARCICNELQKQPVVNAKRVPVGALDYQFSRSPRHLYGVNSQHWFLGWSVEDAWISKCIAGFKTKKVALFPPHSVSWHAETITWVCQQSQKDHWGDALKRTKSNGIRNEGENLKRGDQENSTIHIAPLPLLQTSFYLF